MSEPDPKTTLREFREYFARCYEANNKIAARIGVTTKTFADWLTGDRELTGKPLEKLRKFLDADAKRSAGQRNQTDRARAAENHAATPTVALHSALAFVRASLIFEPGRSFPVAGYRGSALSESESSRELKRAKFERWFESFPSESQSGVVTLALRGW